MNYQHSATAGFYKSGRPPFTGNWIEQNDLQNPSIKHKGHPLNTNVREVFRFLQGKKASKAKKISLETQLKIANLEYENEEFTKKMKN